MVINNKCCDLNNTVWYTAHKIRKKKKNIFLKTWKLLHENVTSTELLHEHILKADVLFGYTCIIDQNCLE